MIRKLNFQDNDLLMDYLVEEKAINLFIIGDIENYGYDTDFQEIWAEFDNNGRIVAVLLRYFHSYIAYAKGNFNIQSFADIISQDQDLEVFSGKKGIIEKFSELIDFDIKKEMFFVELTDNSLLEKNINRSSIHKATIDDVESVFELREQIVEFQTTASSKKSFKQTLINGVGRTYMIKDGNRVVATASTTAENSRSAMIVGVSTHPKYRNKGFATLCMTALCQDILNEGRTLCLFYDNPAAGAIYKRIGFKDIGKWNMYTKKN